MLLTVTTEQLDWKDTPGSSVRCFQGRQHHAAVLTAVCGVVNEALLG